MCKLTCDTKTAMHQLIQRYINMADEYTEQYERHKAFDQFKHMAEVARQAATDMQLIVDNSKDAGSN